jgi:hypothetical protein
LCQSPPGRGYPVGAAGSAWKGHLGREAVVLDVKSTDKPDERRDFPRGHLEVLSLPGLVFGVATFEPGRKWSESVRPIAGTDTCQVHHNGYCVSGRMHVLMDDGAEADVGPGDVFVISPGHDAWIVGDEPFVAYDFAGGAADYAKA